jgi:hypothetical protein
MRRCQVTEGLREEMLVQIEEKVDGMLKQFKVEIFFNEEVELNARRDTLLEEKDKLIFGTFKSRMLPFHKQLVRQNCLEI